MTQPQIAARPARLLPLCVYAGLVLALVWAYWTTLGEMAGRWANDPSYSHGWLVPVFALLLLALRREWMPTEFLRPNWVVGSLVLAAGIAMRLYGTYIYRVSVEQLSLLPVLAGVVLLVGGWPVFRWAWPSVLFFAFMIPLPYRYAGMMAEPLQRFATVVSTFLLQSFGLPALAEGNVILLSEQEMGIVEACSGLRMLVVFFALSTAFALVIKRVWTEKVIIVVSAIPIALACNVIRITATGVLHEAVSEGGILHGYATHDLPNNVFHTLGGYLMPPLGLGMLWVELKLMALLWPETAAAEPEVVQYARVPPPPAATRARRPWQAARSSRAASPAGGARPTGLAG